ncbi:MAG: hypothetical protein Q8P20_06495 [bacterium]|nr:hypothetical protein [bacterium]
MNKNESEFSGVINKDKDLEEKKEFIEKTQPENEINDSTKNEVDDSSAEKEKIEVDISGEVEEDLKLLFKYINKKKFTDSVKNLTPATVGEASTVKLKPIIDKFRKKLKEGGSADPDAIIQEIINEAIAILGEGGFKRHKFLEKITDPAKIDPSSQIAKFNIFIAKSLEKK